MEKSSFQPPLEKKRVWCAENEGGEILGLELASRDGLLMFLSIFDTKVLWKVG